MQDDLDEKIQCKVLDCDTISQVKSKILDALFKNTPFSLRPSIYEVDLEWRHGRGGHLTLQDEDLTTKTVGSWKKLNTLAHYGVKESAVMSLISRQNDSFNNCKQPCHNCEYYYYSSFRSYGTRDARRWSFIRGLGWNRVSRSVAKLSLKSRAIFEEYNNISLLQIYSFIYHETIKLCGLLAKE